jgi:hypothetical protein
MSLLDLIIIRNSFMFLCRLFDRIWRDYSPCRARGRLLFQQRATVQLRCRLRLRKVFNCLCALSLALSPLETVTLSIYDFGFDLDHSKQDKPQCGHNRGVIVLT